MSFDQKNWKLLTIQWSDLSASYKEANFSYFEELSAIVKLA